MSERRTIDPVSPLLLTRATELVSRTLERTPYLAGALESLHLAVQSPGMDARALVCVSGDAIEGVIVFGFFGGASGAGRVHLIAVSPAARRARVGSRLVSEAVAALRANGARFVLAELPDDARALPGARAFLEASAFREESRIADYYRDGVAIAFMRRALDDE